MKMISLPRQHGSRSPSPEGTLDRTVVSHVPVRCSCACPKCMSSSVSGQCRKQGGSSAAPVKASLYDRCRRPGSLPPLFGSRSGMRRAAAAAAVRQKPRRKRRASYLSIPLKGKGLRQNRRVYYLSTSRKGQGNPYWRTGEGSQRTRVQI